MMCFSVHKLRKRYNGGEQAGNLDESSSPEPDIEGASPPKNAIFCSAGTRFRSRVRAIQNAQWFINSNPKLRSSHPSYGSRDENKHAAPDSSLPLLPLGGRARSATELGSSLFDVAAAYHPSHTDQSSENGTSPRPAAHHPPPIDHTSANAPSPRPLPSPRLLPAAQPLNAYRLPLPCESANTTSLYPLSPLLINSPKINTTGTSPPPSLYSATTTTTASSLSSSAQIVNSLASSSTPSQNGIVLPTCAKGSVLDLQPLPPLKEAVTAPVLRCFRYDELTSACQNFSSECTVDDAGECFNGTVKVKANWKPYKHQDIIVIRLDKTHQQGLQEWISKLSMLVNELNEQYVCKLVGFYGEDGCSERMLVYEKLKKGSLCTLLFEEPDVPPLDWPMRMKIVYGAAQGLASLHERFPDRVLYKDFRACCIQVDIDYSSKILGYNLVNPLDAETQTSLHNPRVNAYRAPETISRGELTLKSNIWSFGVILLEVLSGKQNMDERTTKDEKHNLVKWAKPFLMNEGKLFLLMDPKLQGKFPSRGAKMIADLALLCLQRDPAKRPTMKEALDTVKNVHESRYTTRSSTKEPTSSHKVASSSSTLLPTSGPAYIMPSLTNQERASYHRLPIKFDVIENPPLKPLIIPPRCCSENINHHQHDYSSASLAHVKY